MVLPQHEAKKPKYTRWVFLSGRISKTNQRTKHVESLKTRRLDEGSNPSDSTKKKKPSNEGFFVKTCFRYIPLQNFIFTQISINNE